MSRKPDPANSVSSKNSKVPTFIGTLPRSIAIVGNGPSELGKRHRAKIDVFDFVLRFNNFRVAGFEQDYGSRTDLWATTFYHDIIPPQIESVKRVLCVYRFDQPTFFPERYSWNYPNHVQGFQDRTVMIPKHFFTELWAVLLYPTAGISLLWWYWRTYGNLDRKAIFGFSFLNSAHQYHYWDRSSSSELDQVHDGDKERTLFQIMLESDGLNPHLSLIANLLQSCSGK